MERFNKMFFVFFGLIAAGSLTITVALVYLIVIIANHIPEIIGLFK
jgi:hypothetical protein